MPQHTGPTPIAPCPPAALVLGYGGLLPFWGLALLPPAWALALPFSPLKALVFYGALIVTFVGAIAWGVALAHPQASPHQRQRLLVWSVLPSLVSWCLLVLLEAFGAQSPEAAAHATHAANVTHATLAHWTATLGLVALALVALAHDVALARGLPLPAGFLRLRVHLTLGACLGLVVGTFRLEGLPSPLAILAALAP